MSRRCPGRVVVAIGRAMVAVTVITAVVEGSVIRRVPRQHPTIQAAVDAATAGDLILIEPGIYRESIVIRTANIVLRGRDRARVVIDGEGTHSVGVAVTADGVMVENLTVRGFREVGIRWSGVTGYRGRFLTLHDNAVHGVAVDRARDGVLEELYVRGASAAGIALSHCGPCRVLVRRVLAEWNGAGFAAWEASGDVVITDGIWRRNRVGLLPHGSDTIRSSTGTTTLIHGNLIHDNANRSVRGSGRAALVLGTGILISGGAGIHVRDNVIASHVGHGVLVAPLPGTPGQTTRGTVIASNLILSSGRADIAVGGPRTSGTCVAPQRARVTVAPVWLWCSDGIPRGIETDLIPALLFRMRGWRAAGPAPPDRQSDALPLLPSLERADRAPVVPIRWSPDAVDTRPGLGRWPASADSVRQAVEAAGVVPAGTPAIGAFLGALQGLVPLTPTLLGLVGLLLAGWRGAISWRRRHHGQPGRKSLRVWRLTALLAIVWIGLAVAVANSFSGVL